MAYDVSYKSQSAKVGPQTQERIAPPSQSPRTLDPAACLLNLDGTILTTNRDFDELFQAAAQTMVGTDIFEYVDSRSSSDLRLIQAQHLARPGVELAIRMTLRTVPGERDSYFVRSSVQKVGDQRYQLLRFISPASSADPPVDQPSPTNRWASHLEAVREITASVTSATEPEDLYPRIHAAIARVLPADALIIGVVPESPNDGEDQAAVGVYCAEGDLVLEAGTWELSHPLQEAMRSQEIRIHNDIPDDMFRDSDRFGDRTKPVQSLLSAPLIVDQHLIGVIIAQSYAPGAYTQVHAKLLETIARTIAVAIQRSRLLAGLKARIERESRIREMVGFISGTLDDEEVLDRTAQAIFEFLPNQCTAIATTDQAGTLRSRRRFAEDRQVIESGLPPLGTQVHPDSLLQRAYDLGQLVYIRDITEEDSHTLQALYREGVRSVVAVPIPQADGYRGTVFVGRNTIDGFARDEIDLLQTIVGLLGAWLRNAELYMQTTSYAQDLEDVQRISRIVASDLDVDRTLSELISLVPRMLDAEGCSVRVFDGDDLVLAAANGSTARSFAERIRIQDTESSDMPQTLQPVFKRDLRTDAATRDNVREKGILARGWAAAPLLDEHQRMFGALSVHTAEPREWTERDRTILLALATAASQAYRNARAFESTRDVLRASIESLAAAVDAKDPATLNHSRRVASLAYLIAVELDLPAGEVEQIELAALLHDIGKIGIPDRVLQKPGSLDDFEWEIMRSHPSIGMQILDGNRSLGPIVSLVKHHHERWDGTGYPDGLRADNIPLGSAIIGLAEAIETMTSERSYSIRRSWHQTLQEVEAERGSQFHPRVVDALLAGCAAGRITLESVLHERATPDVPTPVVHTHAAVDARSLVVFHRVAQAIRELVELETFVGSITEILEDALDEHTVTIYLRQDESGMLIPYGKPDIEPNHKIKPGYGIVGRVALAGELIHVPDANQEPAFVPSQFNDPGSEIAVPITIDGDVIGVLNAESPRTHAFTGRDESLLSTTAALLARTIQTARLHDELQRMSRTDPLTGLANHRAFYEHLEAALQTARETDTSLSVAIIDLNKLKQINDSFGHVVGDEALRGVAQVLQHGSRPNDIVCRYGGDEFAIILSGTEQHEAQNVLLRLQRIIASRTIAAGEQRIALPGGAWGIASYPEDGDRSATLVATADSRMYEEKP